MKKTLCIIGHERELSTKLSLTFQGNVIVHDMLPQYIVGQNGKLFISKSNGLGYVEVDIVVYHGIFEDDFDLLTALSFWGGPCFPNPLAMMNCRLKLPCLARALRISKFGAPRGMVPEDTEISTKSHLVAKWGNWHCGENKDNFVGKWKSSNVSILEPFFQGDAIRIVIVGDKYLQIRMEGDGWLKSIHDNKARIVSIDKDLLDDSLALKSGFNLEMIANDYIVSDSGDKFLLEVNHIPNMTRFKRLQEIYLSELAFWLEKFY